MGIFRDLCTIQSTQIRNLTINIEPVYTIIAYLCWTTRARDTIALDLMSMLPPVSSVQATCSTLRDVTRKQSVEALRCKL